VFGERPVTFFNLLQCYEVKVSTGVWALAASNSMNGHISNAIKRYSSLFTLPSHKTLLMWLFVTCLINGILIAAAFQLYPYYWLALGLVFGATLFILTQLSDFLIRFSSMKEDPVFNLRRCSALSLYSLLLWLVFIIGGVIANNFYTGFWFKLFLIGFCAAFALRLLVFSAVSFAGSRKIISFAVLPPLLYAITVVYTASAVNAIRLETSLLAFSVFSVVFTATAVYVYIFSINRIGTKILGVDSFSFLRAFMATWTEDHNAPFETLFEKFSQERNIQLSILLFCNAKGVVKAAVIVPAFHPGPFKNLGSSALPNAIQTALENKLEHCVVMVPHGLSGHDLDLATQAQNQIVLERAIRLSDIHDFGINATPSVNVTRDGASVGCQVFNGCAFVTLTLAPETMEDLPPELNYFILEAANKNGFSTAIAVDAHNSIQGPFKIDQAIKPFQEAALISLKKASRQHPASFQVGVARVAPKEFGLSEGMGPGGIAVLVIRVGDQTMAYVTIDGNNMVSGLREHILSALSELGVSNGEIFTTDTHVVNAVVLKARGYHPVGEAMDHESLIQYVKQATLDALASLEQAEVGWRTETVSRVKVIGEAQIEAMCTLMEKAIKKAKRLAVTVFPLLGVVLAALLVLL